MNRATYPETRATLTLERVTCRLTGRPAWLAGGIRFSGRACHMRALRMARSLARVQVTP